MTAAKSKRPRDGSRARRGTGIPKGDDPLPGAGTKVLREMHAEMSGRKDVRKESLIVAAATRWREGLGVSEIARRPLQPRSTVHDWLARLRDRVLGGIPDRTAPNRKSILGDAAWIVIGVWPSRAPQAYGLGSGLWQASMLRKTIPDRLGTDTRPRTPRGAPYRMSLSFRMPREVPRKSADPGTRKKFVEDTQKRMDSLARAGYASLCEDETAMLLSAQASRGRLPRGGRETTGTTFSRRPARVFGALGRGVLHLMQAGPARSAVSGVFPGALRQKYGRAAFVTDNARSRKPKPIRRCLKSAGGDVVLTCPPPHAPQLNPVGVRWRMTGARLAGRCHSAEDETGRSIIRPAGSGGARPVQTSNLPFA